MLVSIACKNENSFYFLFENIFCKFFKIEEFTYETNEFGENLLDHLTEYGSTSMHKVALEKHKTDLFPDGFNIFACNHNKENKFLRNLIKNEDNCEEVMSILNENDGSKHLLLHQIVKFKTFRVFDFCFSQIEQNVCTEN